MFAKSILKPETSVMVGVSTAALIGFVYSYGLPNVATMQATSPQDVNIEAGRRKAAWTSAALVAVLSLLTRDRTVFVIGSMSVVALDWHARLANAGDPVKGKVVSNEAYRSTAQAPATADAAPAYADEG